MASPQSIRREPRTHMHCMSYFGTRRRHRAIRNHLTLRSRPSIRNAISDVITIVLGGKAVSENLPCQDSVLVLLHFRFLLGSMPCGMLCWLLSESYHMAAKNTCKVGTDLIRPLWASLPWRLGMLCNQLLWVLPRIYSHMYRSANAGEELRCTYQQHITGTKWHLCRLGL